MRAYIKFTWFVCSCFGKSCRMHTIRNIHSCEMSICKFTDTAYSFRLALWKKTPTQKEEKHHEKYIRFMVSANISIKLT
jgi:hypothetical protein